MILKGDCVVVFEILLFWFVDLVFVDLFYNLQLGGDLYWLDQFKVDVCDDYWDQFESFQVYDVFIKVWFLVVYWVLKVDGFFYVIGFYYNIFCVGVILQDFGFWIMNDIVWLKLNLMLNFCGKWFINVYEIMIWVIKLKNVKLIFNYDVLKIFNEDLQMCFDWYFLLCIGIEWLKDG